jgi:uncharacterized membrane protein
MHAVLAFAALPLFLGALLSDWAYATSYQVQWANFASWLIAGGLPLAGLALAWGALDLLSGPATRNHRSLAYLLLLLLTFALGLVNALVHARDGWAVMPAGPLLSAGVVVVGLAATLLGLARMPWRKP